MALVSLEFKLNFFLWNFLKFSSYKGFKVLWIMVQNRHGLKFWPTYPMGLLPCHNGNRFIGTNQKTCVLIPIILSKIALVFLVILDCKLHPK